MCNFNKYGFCRYQERCRKFHGKILCENLNCEVRECKLRHPKQCKFLRDYGYCKFGEWCYFSHKELRKMSNAENEELKELKNRFNNLGKKIKVNNERRK